MALISAVIYSEAQATDRSRSFATACKLGQNILNRATGSSSDWCHQLHRKALYRLPSPPIPSHPSFTPSRLPPTAPTPVCTMCRSSGQPPYQRVARSQTQRLQCGTKPRTHRFPPVCVCVCVCVCIFFSFSFFTTSPTRLRPRGCLVPTLAALAAVYKTYVADCHIQSVAEILATVPFRAFGHSFAKTSPNRTDTSLILRTGCVFVRSVLLLMLFCNPSCSNCSIAFRWSSGWTSDGDCGTKQNASTFRANIYCICCNKKKTKIE